MFWIFKFGCSFQVSVQVVACFYEKQLLMVWIWLGEGQVLTFALLYTLGSIFSSLKLEFLHLVYVEAPFIFGIFFF